jgi:hypothetical protein
VEDIYTEKNMVITSGRGGYIYREEYGDITSGRGGYICREEYGDNASRSSTLMECTAHASVVLYRCVAGV